MEMIPKRKLLTKNQTQKPCAIMKKLKFSATVTIILGFLSVLALIFMLLALSDIANHEQDLTLEWYVTGICILILGAFTVSTFVTLGFLLKFLKIFEDNIRKDDSKVQR
jgi:hypothetical protein